MCFLECLSTVFNLRCSRLGRSTVPLKDQIVRD